MLPTEPFSTSLTLERQFCTFSYRPSLLDSDTVWHLAVMPLQVLQSTELLSTSITGYLQGLPLHCRHPASLRELFDRCSDHFLSIPFTSTNFPQPLRLLRKVNIPSSCASALARRQVLNWMPSSHNGTNSEKPPLYNIHTFPSGVVHKVNIPSSCASRAHT